MIDIFPELKNLKMTLNHAFIEKRLTKHPLCVRPFSGVGHTETVSASTCPLETYIPKEGERQYTKEGMD